MTPDQFDRWKDFALRMARTCYKGRRKPGRQWIEAAVEDCFDGIDDDYWPLIEDWEHSAPYPEGHVFHGINRLLWDPTPACAPLLCDYVAEWGEEYVEANAVMPKRLMRRIDAALWREDDELADTLDRHWEDRWIGPVRCCVRAGLDLAVAPSGGVTGFTARDIRAMYPEGVPDWVKNGEWSTQSFAPHPLGMAPLDEPHDPKPFDALPDSAALWL